MGHSTKSLQEQHSKIFNSIIIFFHKIGIVVFKWGEEDNNKLTLVMNRDDWEPRVIRPTTWDEAGGQILGGQSDDLNGTWFGISQQGRVAFLVNNPYDEAGGYGGSAAFLNNFFEGNLNPQEFADHLAAHHNTEDQYRKLVFDLIVGDMNLNSMVRIFKPTANDLDVQTEIVPFGVHSLSAASGFDLAGHNRDSRVRGFFNQTIGEFGGIIDIARQMIQREGFGTTSTIALAVERSGEVMVFERFRNNDGWNEHDFNFHINII